LRIYEDLRAVQTRVTVLQYCILGLIGMLLVIFWHLQVVQGRKYREQAENNRRRNVPIAAPRGVLLDRNDKILVENRPSFNVMLRPEHSENLDATVAQLSRLLRVGESPIRERLPRRGTSARDIVVKADASIEDVASIEARRLELPETTIQVVPIRSYPLGPAAAHVLGSVGEITEQQLRSASYEGLSAGDLVGRDGVEAQYNRSIMGQDGMREIIVNSRGIEVAREDTKPPIVGPSLTLSLDAGLQATMEQAFAGRPGSGVALDPRTGEILAMTSIPAFDPNRFTTGIDRALWTQLNTDPDKPLLNRVIQGKYAPGSVFKIVTTIAALEEGLITPSTTFHCNGIFRYGNKEFNCHKGFPPHGTVSLIQAVAQSCNVYFYNVGVMLGIDRIAKYAKRMGLGAPTGVDLPGEIAGTVPSPEWKLKETKQPWYPGETVSVAIGQGDVGTTPIQLARLAAIAATGKLVTPHLVRRVGEKPWDGPQPVDLGFRPETLATLRTGMCAVVSEGTARRVALPGVTVCGKTGTAQVVGHARLSKEHEKDEENLPHGWFVAFAPKDDPQIAIAVMVEHGASGAGSAGPIAHDVLAHFFGLNLPRQAGPQTTKPAIPAPAPAASPAPVIASAGSDAPAGAPPD
jgi:penicillin-binding protein 2